MLLKPFLALDQLMLPARQLIINLDTSGQLSLIQQ
jgi:hypothetical protein